MSDEVDQRRRAEIEYAARRFEALGLRELSDEDEPDRDPFLSHGLFDLPEILREEGRPRAARLVENLVNALAFAEEVDIKSLDQEVRDYLSAAVAKLAVRITDPDY